MDLERMVGGRGKFERWGNLLEIDSWLAGGEIERRGNLLGKDMLAGGRVKRRIRKS